MFVYKVVDRTSKDAEVEENWSAIKIKSGMRDVLPKILLNPRLSFKARQDFRAPEPPTIRVHHRKSPD